MSPKQCRIWTHEGMVCPDEGEAFMLNQHGDVFYVRPDEIQLGPDDNSIGRARWEYNQVEVMWSVGREDRNAQTIYEGDIIEYWSGRRGLVEWSDYHTAYTVGVPVEITGTVLDDCEVIGDKHRNPDLLKDVENA